MESIGDLERLEKTIIDRANSLKRQREFIEQVRAAASLDPPNYSVLRRLLALPAKDEVLRDFGPDASLLDSLQHETDDAWGRMRLSAVNDFVQRAHGEDLQVRGQAPRFTVGRGVEVTFDLSGNRTNVNGTIIKSVDSRDVIDKVRAEEERVWGEKLDLYAEIERIRSATNEVAGRAGGAEEGVPILLVFEELGKALRPRERKRFTREVFAARLSRLLDAGTLTSDHRALVLKPTASRDDALWVYLPDQGDWAYRGRLAFKEAG